MVVTYSNQDTMNYLQSPSNNKMLRGGYLLVNEAGGWAYLSADEFKMLQHNCLDINALAELKTQNIVYNEFSAENLVFQFNKTLAYLSKQEERHTILFKDHMPDKDGLKKIIDFIAQSPSNKLTVEFAGSRPLHDFKLLKGAISNASSKGKRIEWMVCTDATDLTLDALDFLITQEVSVTLVLNTLKDVLNVQSQKRLWLEKLAKDYKLMVRYFVSSDESKDIPNFISLLQKYNIQEFEVLPKYGGQYLECFFAVWKRIVQDLVASNSPIIEKSTLGCLSRMLQNQVKDAAFLGFPWGDPVQSLCYSSTGDVFYYENEPQDCDIFRLGGVSQTYSKVIGSPESKAVIQSSLYHNPVYEGSFCRPYFGISPFFAYLTTGTILEQFPNPRSSMIEKMFNFLFETFIFERTHQAAYLRWIKNQ